MTRRSHRLALACLAVATAATLAGCQRGDNTVSADPGSRQQPPASSLAPADSPMSTPPQREPGPSASTTPVTSRGTDFGFIRSWYAKQGTFYLRFDRAVLLTGKAADAASAAHGGASPVENDYYIQNDNPRLRDLLVLDQATVIGSQQLTGSPAPKPSSLKQLLTFVAAHDSAYLGPPFHLRYNGQGQVVRIEEMYVP